MKVLSDNKEIRRITELCSQYNMSYYKLAKMAGIPRNTLNKMIAKGNSPTIGTLNKICNGLGITKVQFFSSHDIYPEISEEEETLLKYWDLLHPEDKKTALLCISILADRRTTD